MESYNQYVGPLCAGGPVRVWRELPEGQKVASDLVLWNIPADYPRAAEGFIPLVRLVKGERFTVDLNELYILKVEDPQEVAWLHHVSMFYGACSLKETKRKLSLYKKEHRKRILSKALETWRKYQEER